MTSTRNSNNKGSHPANTLQCNDLIFFLAISTETHATLSKHKGHAIRILLTMGLPELQQQEQKKNILDK